VTRHTNRDNQAHVSRLAMAFFIICRTLQARAEAETPGNATEPRSEPKIDGKNGS